MCATPVTCFLYQQQLPRSSRGEEKIRVGLAENQQSISVTVGAYESARTGEPVNLI